jgi:hypothetical protein
VTGATGPAGVVMTASMHASGAQPPASVALPTSGYMQLSPSVSVVVTATTDKVFVSAGADLYSSYGQPQLMASVCSQSGTNTPVPISDEPSGGTGTTGHTHSEGYQGNYWIAHDGVATGLAAGTYSFFLCGNSTTGFCGLTWTTSNPVGWWKTVAMILP